MADERQLTSELVEKLGRWLEQQPEYPLLFLADRQRRRRAATAVAHRLMILPSVPARSQTVTRADARAAEKRMKGMIGQVKTSMSRKTARLAAKAERDRRRHARLSAERALELAERAFDGEGYQYADESDPAFD